MHCFVDFEYNAAFLSVFTSSSHNERIQRQILCNSDFMFGNIQSESGCGKCMALKKYLLDHWSSWKLLWTLLCPSTLHWCFHFHFKLSTVAAGTTFVKCLLLICRFGGVSPCRLGGKSLNSVIKFIVSSLLELYFMSYLIATNSIAWTNHKLGS